MLFHRLTRAASQRAHLAQQFQRHKRSFWEASVLAAAWVTSSNNRASQSSVAPLPTCGLSREAADVYSDSFSHFAEHARECYVDGVSVRRPDFETSPHTIFFQPERPLEAIDELFRRLRATEAPALQHVAVEVASELNLLAEDEPIDRAACAGRGPASSRVQFVGCLRELLGPALPIIVQRGVPGIADIQRHKHGGEEDVLHPLAVFSYGVQEVVDWHVWHASTLLR